jgi:hypothetical protein
MPADMLELIGRYEYGVKRGSTRSSTIWSPRTGSPGPAAGLRARRRSVRTLPPIMYPGKILNAAVNFYSHVNETGTPEEQAAARGSGARSAACRICS